MKATMILIYLLTSGEFIWEELPAEICRASAAVWADFPNGWTEHDGDFVEVSGAVCLTRDAAVRAMMLGQPQQDF